MLNSSYGGNSTNDILLRGTKNRILKLCFGHLPPLFDCSGFIFVTSSHEAALSFKGESIVLPDDLSHTRGYDGGVISEYQQIFELHPYIEACASSFDYLHITQYRKFISNIPGRRLSAHMPHLYTCTPNEANNLHGLLSIPLAEREGDLPSLMCGHYLKLKGTYADQYSRLHVLEDYIKFLYSVDKVCGFDSTTFKLMAETNTFFPTPSLGLMPVKFYSETINTLIKVWNHFVEEHLLVPRGDYQRRVGGFLLERLHSLLYLNAVYSSSVRIFPLFQYVVASSNNEPRPTGL
jgi:hypothetical protein